MPGNSISKAIKLMADRRPHKTAIEYREHAFTYADLEQESGRIACLLDNFLSEQRNVFVLLEPCPELIFSLLGIVKAGGIFLPLDPDLPVVRMGMMIDYGRGDMIITRQKWLDKLARIMKVLGKKMPVYVIDQPETEAWTYEALMPVNIPSAPAGEVPDIVNKNCYIYFSSGSTGTPKAILGRQKSLMHFIEWETEEFRIDENFRISQLTPTSFDPFLRDVFLALCNGATLCIPPDRKTILDPDALLRWIDESGISLIHLVPSLFRLLAKRIKNPEHLSALKYVMLAGEMLRGHDVKDFLSMYGERIQLVNLYGPTETTLAKMFYRISKEDSERIRIPVGKPISRTETVILDENLKPVNSGSPGEVFIRTPFISGGYYKNPELTKKAFLRNPFSNNPHDIIYKTGDLGIKHGDGNVELIGRVDHQVKIRGVRIEISEIEALLLSCKELSDVVILDKEDKEGNKYLCAYYVSGREVSPSVLREYLSGKVAGAMIPSQFIQVEAIPLTPNGKVDRKKLSGIRAELTPGDGVFAPKTKTEKAIACVWEELLDTKGIGIHDKFLDVGGNSMLVIQLYVRLDELYPSVIDATDVFNNQTIHKQAKLIDLRKAETTAEIVLQPLELTEDFFNLSGVYNDNSLIRYTIDGCLLAKLRKIHSGEGVPLHDILLAMYVYSLAETTGNGTINIQAMNRVQNRITPLEIKMNEIDDFSMFFNTVKHKQAAEDSPQYPLGEIKKLRINYKENSLLPLFYLKRLYAEKVPLLEFFDLTAEISEEERRIDFCCDYNPRKLNEEKVAELAENYLELLNLLAEKY